MKDLNNLEEIKKLDPQDAFGSTEMLVQQLEAAWNQVNDLNFSQDLQDFGSINVNNLVFCGMGASVYGALAIKALFGTKLPYPIDIVSDYHLPEYVNNDSLVVLTSYSGTTEEVISCAKEAKEKAANMLVLTKGGPLADFAKANFLPAFIFDGALNPSGVPRLGTGYTILGLIGLLAKAGIIKLNEMDIKNAIENLKQKVTTIKEKAKQDAQIFINKTPIIFAGEHLAANAQILRNQFNETSKTFSAYYLVPDLNHHLMEGLQFPKPSNLHFIILNSNNYSPKNKQRMQLTVDVVKKNNQPVFEFTPTGTTIYDDFLETLVYSGYLTIYLAFLNDQNPAINPWVDYFKQELNKNI